MAKFQPRAVRCVETGDVYQSSGAAGRAFNIDPSGILKCCKGLANHAAGHTWVFADEDDEDQDSLPENQVEDDEIDDQYEDDDDGYDDDDYEEDDRTVADFMKTDVVTIKASDSLAVAEHIMLEGNFFRLPVVDAENKLIGIITQYDIKNKKTEITEFTESKFLDPNLPVEKFVNREVVITTPDEAATEIARAADDYNAKFLPVIASREDRTLVGIVTYFDYINNR